MSLIRTLLSWRLRPPFFYGWLVLGVASVAAFAATGVAQTVLGGIQTFIFEEQGWDRGTIAYAITAGTWTSGLLTPLAGRLADRYGPRWMMPIGIIIVGVCYFGLSGIHAIWHFYIAYIIGRAVASPFLIGVVPRTAAVNFFQRKRNFALGLTATARPIGVASNVQIISIIAQAYTWRVAYRVLGIFALALVVPLFLVMRRRPEDIGLKPDGERTTPSGEVSSSRDSAPDTPALPRPRPFEWRAGEAAGTSTFRLIVLADFMFMLTGSTVNFQVVPFLRDTGLSQSAAAGALSLAILLGAFTNPSWGYLSDRYPVRKLMLIGVAVSGVLMALLLTSDSSPIRFVLIVLWGTTSGGFIILSNMMLAQFFGRESFGAITGLLGPFQVGAIGLGPTIGAVMFKLTGGYTTMLLFGVAAYSLAAVLIYWVRTPRLPTRAETVQVQ